MRSRREVLPQVACRARRPATSRCRSCARCRSSIYTRSREATSGSSSRTFVPSRSAERFIYVENQFLWSPEIAGAPREAPRSASRPTSGCSPCCRRNRQRAGTTRVACWPSSSRPTRTRAACSPARSTPVRAGRRSDLRAREGRDRRRQLADDRLCKPERALALQRHRDERRRPRPRLARSTRLRSVGRAPRADGGSDSRRPGARDRRAVETDQRGAARSATGWAAVDAPPCEAAARLEAVCATLGPLNGMLVDG